jgi:lysozyme family protein
MKENFELSLQKVIEHEGGYVNHPADPGGRTNLGVTQRVWEEWVGRPVTEREMRALTVAQVSPLYKKRYWDAIHGDRLPAGLDYCLFDTAINSGVGRASRFIQEMVGVTADGVIGPRTLLAISNRKDTAKLINEYCDKRLDFLQKLKTWPVFGRGWGRRVADVRATATRMVSTRV